MKKAFTLVELLVVIAIISILSAALYGGTIYAMRVARRQACRGHLKTVGVSTQAYEAENAGKVLTTGTTNKHPAYRFARLIYLGMIENSQILYCPECPSADGRDLTFVKTDFAEGNEEDGAFSTAEADNLKPAVDYALQNCKIPDRFINILGYSADGFHGTELEDQNHENYGSVLYKGGNVVGIGEPSWWLKAGVAELSTSSGGGSAGGTDTGYGLGM